MALTAALALLAVVPARAGDIAILMSADVPEFQEARRGFEAGLTDGHSVVASYDMRGDADRGRRFLAEIQTKVQPDLILAVGVFALQVVVESEVTIPVIYSMVLNPPSVVGAEHKDITGASINVPVARGVAILRQLSQEIQQIGVVFDPDSTGYLIPEAQRAARRQSIELVVRSVSSTKEAIAALDSLQKEGVDALWLFPDATVLEEPVVDRMLLVSYHEGIPLLGLSHRHAKMGALLALYFASSEDIGRQAAGLANRILATSPPGDMPYTTAREVALAVNLKTANKLGVRIPDVVLETARDVIQ